MSEGEVMTGRFIRSGRERGIRSSGLVRSWVYMVVLASAVLLGGCGSIGTEVNDRLSISGPGTVDVIYAGPGTEFALDFGISGSVDPGWSIRLSVSPNVPDGISCRVTGFSSGIISAVFPFGGVDVVPLVFTGDVPVVNVAGSGDGGSADDGITGRYIPEEGPGTHHGTTSPTEPKPPVQAPSDRITDPGTSSPTEPEQPADEPGPSVNEPDTSPTEPEPPVQAPPDRIAGPGISSSNDCSCENCSIYGPNYFCDSAYYPVCAGVCVAKSGGGDDGSGDGGDGGGGDDGGGGSTGECTRDNQCPSGQVCRSNRCVGAPQGRTSTLQCTANRFYESANVGITVSWEAFNGGSSQGTGSKSGSGTVVFLDGVPPSSAISISGNKVGGFYEDSATYSLSCSDQGAGCETTYSCLAEEAGCDPVEYTLPVTVSCDSGELHCVREVYYWSVDGNGNEERRSQALIPITVVSDPCSDAVNPVDCRCSLNPDLPYCVCQDDPDSLQCTCQEDPEQLGCECVENPEVEGCFCTLYPDEPACVCNADPGVCDEEVAPTTSCDLTPDVPDGNDSWYRSDVQVDFRCSDSGGSGCFFSNYCKTLTDSCNRLRTGNSMVVDVDGNWSVLYKSIDVAGNVEELQSCSVHRDATPPTSLFYFTPTGPDGARGWFVTPPEIDVVCYDKYSGCSSTEYCLDDVCLVDTGYRFSADGNVSVLARSRDNAGNIEQVQPFSVLIDGRVPTITCDDCFTFEDFGVTFTPEIVTGPSGIYDMTICEDDRCRASLCANSTGSCTYISNGCIARSGVSFWIKVVSGSGLENTIYGGEFSIDKTVGCTCTDDRECLSGVCGGAPQRCVGSQPPKIYFE